ncbi:hypothetical protein BC828DRAFT_390056 [Blastocladiella britannica]|nr:hypothetical protein BC828DRAFT_390056 [Blastocladiella britannica]
MKILLERISTVVTSHPILTGACDSGLPGTSMAVPISTLRAAAAKAKSDPARKLWCYFEDKSKARSAVTLAPLYALSSLSSPPLISSLAPIFLSVATSFSPPGRRSRTRSTAVTPRPTRFHNGARCACGVDDTTWHWLGCTLARDDRDAALAAARADMTAYSSSLLPAPASRSVPTPAPPPAPAPLPPPIVALARRLTDLVCIRRLAAGLVQPSDVAMVCDALVELFADGRPPLAVRIMGHLVHALATRLCTMVHRPHINRLQRRDFDEGHAENPEAPPAKGLRFETNRATGRLTGDSYPSRPLPTLQRTVLPIRHGALFHPGASPGACR